MKLNWKKIWDDFDKWHEKLFCEWEEQKKKIEELIERDIDNYGREK